MKTLYEIQVNPALLWDYEFRQEEFRTEDFFVWYLGRQLDNGTFDEVRAIPHEVIAKYLDRLRICRRVREFWKWFLNAESPGQ